MKIIFDYEIFTKQKYGGISNYFCCIGNEIVNQKELLRIIAPIHKNFYLDKFNKNNKFGYNFFFPNKLIKPVEKLNQLISNRLISRFEPNIIHNTYFFNNQIKNKKAKNVLTFMDLTHELYGSETQENKKIIEWKKKCIKQSDHIIVPTYTVKKGVMERYNVNEENITLTFLSSDYKIDYIKDTTQKKLKEYILYVGGRSGYKNFESFVNAYSKSEKLKKDFKILIFGGEKKEINGIDILKKYKIDNTKFTFVNGDEDYLKELYKNVSCLIYPSFYEGFGIPVLEAMSSGCPVILSNAEALKEVGGDGLNYFLPENIDDIVEHLETVLFSNEQINNIINYGLSRSQKFSWKKCASETLKVYKKIQ